jgi:hypothetical protein
VSHLSPCVFVTNCFVTAAEEDSDDDAANAMGELSIDSNSQVCFYDTRSDVSGTNRKLKVRFHGGSSGLKLLMQTQRDDDTGAGGLWSVILLILRSHLTQKQEAARYPIWL